MCWSTRSMGVEERQGGRGDRASHRHLSRRSQNKRRHVSKWSAHCESYLGNLGAGKIFYTPASDCGATGTSLRRINMAPDILLRGVLTLLFVTSTCFGFNIDERFPVIKEGKTTGSLFGFSVALHYQTQGLKQYL